VADTLDESDGLVSGCYSAAQDEPFDCEEPCTAAFTRKHDLRHLGVNVPLPVTVKEAKGAELEVHPFARLPHLAAAHPNDIAALVNAMHVAKDNELSTYVEHVVAADKILSSSSATHEVRLRAHEPHRTAPHRTAAPSLWRPAPHTRRRHGPPQRGRERRPPLRVRVCVCVRR
jgi:hypothetical protein